MKITQAFSKEAIERQKPELLMNYKNYSVIFYPKTFDKVNECDIIKVEEEIKNKLRFNSKIDLDKEIKYITIFEEDDKLKYIWSSESNLPFERIRRITGYLTGTLDRFNDAKKAEEKDRVKHTLGKGD